MKKAARLIFLLTLLFFAGAVDHSREDPPIDVGAIPAADLSGLRYGSYGKMNYYKFATIRPVQYRGKPVRFAALSPSEKKLGFFYEPYGEAGNEDSAELIVMDVLTRKSNQVYTGGWTGAPEWLGNGHIFFTSYCGTSCQGLYLVNTLNKETRIGVLSYMVIDPKRPAYTHFRDWFDEEFEFDGLVREIKSETIGNKAYLVFEMQDGAGKPAGEKKFLFTGAKLAAVNN